ncbi:MAG: monovalent cation/H(+) antiporter subunit G [Acidimicrobiia bacterium]|nr:monovalent cation/H(+) antiporter subunit G [Acidimicrobiia bacterium]
MTDLVSSALLLLGTALTLLSAIGLHRYRDVFARTHPAGKAAPLGATLVAIAVSLQLADPAATLKLAVALLLLLLTFPTGLHMVVRAAYRSGTELNADVEVDELADAVRASDDDPDGTADAPG